MSPGGKLQSDVFGIVEVAGCWGGSEFATRYLTGRTQDLVVLGKA